ncbi:uncharacterized protein EV420DRAFT_354027 [Desarmillaria tabescens]|uniref:Uncharacterized protein n=1 Tax=Armillaria tabescens TaxID=1929756 RepID=A0AA39N505_ARMTA|nr:uncharacterized protein EV420DRAFT_354027 [Desarmillaria tabescens]KAK0458386.1 hypothetical protein EV420DRAFT_354027 [Desarmillaria tabescens]
MILPSSGRCNQATVNILYCQCQWFFPPESPLLDQVDSHLPSSIFSCSCSQNICGLCGHGIHAHVDYVSTVVNHYPANQCAAYVQKTPLTQRCTCEAQFYEHVAIYNSYRFPEPWTVFDLFGQRNNSSSLSTTSSYYSNGANATIPFTPTPVSSPSSSSISSAFQPDTTQNFPGGYSSDGYFIQYPDHFISSPYAGMLVCQRVTQRTGVSNTRITGTRRMLPPLNPGQAHTALDPC